MKFTLIRNATCLIAFGGKRWLIDPMLAEQGTYPAFANTPHADCRNPLVPLPLPLSDLLDIDAVIVTHTHTDHWDAIAAQHIPKEIPIFVQHTQDAAIVRQSGFRHVHVLNETRQFGDIQLFKTAGQHGSDEALADPVLRQRLGDVCGVVMKHPTEQTLYIAGDTLWNKDVAHALARYLPRVIVLNCGEATFNSAGAIIMGIEDVRQVCDAAPYATIIACHMEALNHCILSRQALREAMTASGQAAQIRIPADGEAYLF